MNEWLNTMINLGICILITVLLNPLCPQKKKHCSMAPFILQDYFYFIFVEMENEDDFRPAKRFRKARTKEEEK